MGLFLQWIALLQFFLPGLLFLRLLKLRRTFLRTVLHAFALSGLFNYALVLLLSAAGLFTQEVVLLLVLLEILLLFFTGGQVTKTTFSLTAVDEFFASEEGAVRRISQFLFYLAVAALGIQGAEALRGFGQIFSAWDSVLSWNEWAVDWFSGTIGTRKTYGYPQLIPCMWAMAYQISGEVLNFVPKGTAMLCPFFVSLMLFDLAFALRKGALFGAVVLNAWFLRNLDPAGTGAEADLIASFYTCAVFHLLFLARRSERNSNLLLAALTAIAAGCAKQSGLVILFLLPVLAYSFGLLRGRELLRGTVCYLLLALLFAGPYYLRFALRASQGSDRSNYTHVTKKIYGGRGRGELFTAASKQFLCKLQLGMERDVPTPKRADVRFDRGILHGILQFYGWQFWPALAVLILNVLCLTALKKTALWRGIVWGIVLPYILVWSLLFCYDLRNLMPFLPLYASGLALGFLTLAERRWFRRLLLLSAGLLLIGLLIFFPERRLRNYHDSLRLGIGDLRLNRILLPYLKQPGRIATDYQFLRFLPGGKEKLFFVEYSMPDAGKEHEEALRNPEVRCLLLPRYAAEEWKKDVNDRLKNREIRLLFSAYGYTLYQKTGER